MQLQIKDASPEMLRDEARGNAVQGCLQSYLHLLPPLGLLRPHSALATSASVSEPYSLLSSLVNLVPSTSGCPS